MKRISRFVGIALVAALPAVSQAQTSNKPVSFGIMGGASIPVGDFGDASDLGFQLGAHLLLSPVKTPAVAFRGDITYDRWNYKSLSNANTNTLGIMGNVIVRSSSPMTVRPYGIAGVGLLSTKGTSSVTVGGVTTTVDSDRSNNLGLQVGGGLEFPLSGFTTFVEAKYVNAFAKDGNDDRVNRGNIPITFGIRF